MAVRHGDLSLFEAFAESVGRLSGYILFQYSKLLRRQLTGDLAFRYAPELLIPHFSGEGDLSDLPGNIVVLTVVVHESPLCLCGQTFTPERRVDAVHIADGLVIAQFGRLILSAAPSVALKAIYRHRHIQLERSQLGRQHGEAVLTGDQRQRPAVVPFHQKLAGVIHHLHAAFGAGFHRRVGI